MRAIVVAKLGEPEVLELAEADVPMCREGEVLIDVRAIGVNPVDTYIRSGKLGARAVPYTPGNDAAGIVLAVGGGGGAIAVGDRVYTSQTISGAYAEKTLARALHVHPLPDAVSFEEGAAVGTPAGTAYVALFLRARVRPGETVLIHGASGAVGLSAVQLARAAGLTVIGTAGSEEGKKLVRAQGAHHVIDHHDKDEVEQVRVLTNGRGLDVVIEMLANENLARDLGMLDKRGRVVVVGSRGPIQIDPRDTMSRNSDIRGMSLSNATDDEVAQIYAVLHAALEAKTLRPIIARVLPLADARVAHEAITTGKALGKIVLRS